MDTITGVVFIVIILAFSITLHEFMHGFVAFKLGDDTARLSGRLSLNPIRHIDPFLTILMPIIFYLLAGFPIGAAKPVPFNPSRLRNGETGMAMVGVAGPLTNLVLALFMSIWVRLLPAGGIWHDFFVLFVVVNLAFFVFNMIPFPPLDGSRVVYALAPEGLRGLMRQIESFGLFGIVLFIFLLFPLISPILGRIITALMGLLIPGFDLNSLQG
ncbi:site-2 protease family protein [Candidatus Microgenomates bacterium]|nr:site-2 protease family protein [Candidatus Microgenomates bacterium]